MDSARIRQWFRCSSPLAHFWKWNLGDGERCPWCWLCRTIPLARRILPYSPYGAYWCYTCEDYSDAGPDDDTHMMGGLPCDTCGGMRH